MHSSGRSLGLWFRLSFRRAIYPFLVAAGLVASACRPVTPPQVLPLVPLPVRTFSLMTPTPAFFLEERQLIASASFGGVGIQPQFTTPETIDYEPWKTLNREDWAPLRQRLRELDPHRLHTALVLADFIWYDDGVSPARLVGGLGWNSGPAVIALNSCGDVIAHELGHTLTLPHRDERLPCNIMVPGLCCPSGVGTFNDAQVTQMQQVLAGRNQSLQVEDFASEPDYICSLEEIPHE